MAVSTRINGSGMTHSQENLFNWFSLRLPADDVLHKSVNTTSRN